MDNTEFSLLDLRDLSDYLNVHIDMTEYLSIELGRDKANMAPVFGHLLGLSLIYLRHHSDALARYLETVQEKDEPL